MSDNITIAVICGTTREGRESIKPAQWVAQYGRKLPGVEIIFVDPREVHLPPDGAPEDGEDSGYAEVTKKADAFYIVTPEYNHSFPSSLKRLLDSEYANYMHKPVATAGVSSGVWGGVRVCEALLPVYHKLGMVIVNPESYFPKVQDIFEETGAMKPEFEAMYTKTVGKVYAELVWMARALKAARVLSVAETV